jgi:hypothetical protein
VIARVRMLCATFALQVLLSMVLVLFEAVLLLIDKVLYPLRYGRTRR